MNSTNQASFNPAFNFCFGSSKSTFIINRLEYWFKIKKEGFYKFLEPCNHRAYKHGDSWTEELGFCRKTFNVAFDLIVSAIKARPSS